MKSPLEKRLDKLREQQLKINEEIKKIETEKKNELRKIEAKKEALIGAMVLEAVKNGKALHITSESELLDLLHGFLTRKIDRDLFGLNTSSEEEHTPSETPSPASQTTSTQTDTQASKSPENEKPKKTGSSSAKRLAVTTTQKDLTNEFNM